MADTFVEASWDVGGRAYFPLTARRRRRDLCSSDDSVVEERKTHKSPIGTRINKRHFVCATCAFTFFELSLS